MSDDRVFGMLASLHESLALCQKLDDRRGQAASLGNVGLVHKRRGDHDQALALHRQVGYRRGQASSLLRPPGNPRGTQGIYTLMQRHGLPSLAAHNTAMIEAVAELPPIVVSELFGVHPGTAHTWAKLAQTSWTDYLAACQPAQ